MCTFAANVQESRITEGGRKNGRIFQSISKQIGFTSPVPTACFIISVPSLKLIDITYQFHHQTSIRLHFHLLQVFEVLSSGGGLKKFLEMLAVQGVSRDVIDKLRAREYEEVFTLAGYQTTIESRIPG